MNHFMVPLYTENHNDTWGETIVSTETRYGDFAIEMGAVDFISKPKVNIKTELAKYLQEVRDKVRGSGVAQNSGVRKK